MGIRFRTVGIINGPGRPFSYTGVCEIIVAIDFVCGLPSRGPSLFQCCAHAALECKGVRNNRRLLHGLFFEIDNFEIGGPGGLTGNEYKTFRGRRLFRTHRSRVTTEFLIWRHPKCAIVFKRVMFEHAPRAANPRVAKPPSAPEFVEASLLEASLLEASFFEASLLPPRGQPPRGQPPRGQPPRGQPPQGQPPRGQLLRGQSPASSRPASSMTTSSKETLWRRASSRPTSSRPASKPHTTTKPAKKVLKAFQNEAISL